MSGLGIRYTHCALFYIILCLNYRSLVGIKQTKEKTPAERLDWQFILQETIVRCIMFLVEFILLEMSSTHEV
jgi:hypothetical protein